MLLIVTQLWDPRGHRILIEFPCEFTKQYLGMKVRRYYLCPFRPPRSLRVQDESAHALHQLRI